MLNFLSLFFSEDFSKTDCVLAAVSGGSDSLAMLFLLREYLTYTEQKKELIVVTVDHRLRRESSKEAEEVANLCRRQAIIHETYIWKSEKPKTGIVCKARLARYALLCEAAEKYGASVIVTGHTLDDQIETYMMRAERGQGRGLAAMPRLALLRHKFYLLRPLLGIRRKALQHYLEKRSVLWISDPSNDNLSYERVRVRKALDEATVQKIHKIVSCEAERRKKEAKYIAYMAEKTRMSLRSARFWLNIKAERAALFAKETIGKKELAERDSLINLVSIAAAIMGGVQYPANDKKKNILSFLEMPVKNMRRMTLSGSILELTEKFLRIWREKRNLTTVIIPPGYNVVWDGRYYLHNRSSEILVVRSPSKTELHEIVSHLPKESARFHDLHMPSLETSCLVCFRTKYAMPVFSQNVLEQRGVFTKNVLSPFNWLVSGYDFPIFRCFQKIFVAGSQKMVKCVHSYEDLLPPILETARSKPILRRNVSLVSPSFS